MYPLHDKFEDRTGEFETWWNKYITFSFCSDRFYVFDVTSNRPGKHTYFSKDKVMEAFIFSLERARDTQ